MESVDLNMGEIFEEDDMEPEDYPNAGPLPDLPENEENEDDNEERENMEVLAKLKDLSKGAGKKVIRRPQPKLDSTRLTGERGIPILPKVFDKVKFKGKGHEAHDLGVTMRQLEHWAHRLFPKMPFDEVIERVEKLGNKKEVQTCVKKMRMDIPVLFDVDGEEVDTVNRGSDQEEEDEDNVRRGLDEPAQVDREAEDLVWNDIIRQEDKERSSQAQQTTHDASMSSQHAPVLSQGAATPKTPVQSASSQAASQGLTPEQQERMERNKRNAHEKRMARLGLSSQGNRGTPCSPLTKTPSQQNSSVRDTGSSRDEPSDCHSSSQLENNIDMSQDSELRDVPPADLGRESEDTCTSRVKPEPDTSQEKNNCEDISKTLGDKEAISEKGDNLETNQREANKEVSSNIQETVESDGDSSSTTRVSFNTADSENRNCSLPELSCRGETAMKDTEETENIIEEAMDDTDSQLTTKGSSKEGKSVLKEVNENGLAMSENFSKVEKMATSEERVEDLNEKQLLDVLEQ